MIFHRMDSGNNEVDELHCALIGVISLVRLHIHARLVGGINKYNLEFNVFEIELLLNCVF